MTEEGTGTESLLQAAMEMARKAGEAHMRHESNSKCKFMQPYRKNASLECRSQFSPVDDG